MTAVSLHLQYVVRSTLIVFRGSFWIWRCLSVLSGPASLPPRLVLQ